MFPYSPPATVSPRRGRGTDGSHSAVNGLPSVDGLLSADDPIVLFEEDYRLGGPVLPAIFDEVLTFSQNHPWAIDPEIPDHLKSICRRNLEAYSVRWYSMDAFLAPVKGHTYKVFTISARKPDEDVNDSWFHPLWNTLREFRQLGYNDVVVELTDPRFHEYETFPISHSDPITSQWEQSIRGQFLRVLQDPTQIFPWRAMDVFRYGAPHSHNDNPITVIISLDEEADFTRYRQMKRDLTEVCERVAHFDLRVAIFRGRPQRFKKLDESHYKKDVGLGASISIKGFDKMAGSFGGYLTLRNPKTDAKKRFGVTCWHVVWPTDPRTPVDESFDVNGVKPGMFSEEVVQPALCDHHDTLKKLQYDLGLCQDMVNARKEQDWEAALESHKVRERERKEFYRRHADLGRVWAGSGFRRNAENKELDWALIEVHESRQGSNHLPGALAFPTGFPEEWEPPITRQISDIVRPGFCESVFKIGRSTGRTGGIVSGIRSDLMIDIDDRNGMRRRETPSRAWVVRGTRGRPFSVPGDSGTFALGPTGKWMGLIWGGRERMDWTYVTEASVVIADIQHVTGWEFVGFDAP